MNTSEKTRKTYKPMDLDAAESVCYDSLPSDFVMNDMSDVEKLVYAEIIALHRRIDDVENQATEMMSPEALSDMAGKFFGGGFGT